MNKKELNDTPSRYLDAADKTNLDKLPQWAIDDLHASGLDQATIDEMQCTPILNNGDLKEIIGFTHIDGKEILAAAEGAYYIPYWENDGEYSTFERVKLQKPIVRKNGEIVKYLSPLATKANAFHAFFLPDENKKFRKNKLNIIFVEGEKKAAKLTQDIRAMAEALAKKGIDKKDIPNFVVVGFPGVTTWKDWPGWETIKISGNRVWICFDAKDYGTFNGEIYSNHENCMVEDQAMKLWLFLMYQKKARDVKIMTWDDPECKGIDDYLAAYPGSLQELLDSAQSPFDALPRYHAANGWLPLADLIASLFLKKNQYSCIYESNDLQRRYRLTTKTWQEKVVAAINQSKKPKQEGDKKEDTEKPKEPTPCWIDEKGRVNPGIASEAFLQNQQGNLIYINENFYQFVVGVWKVVDERLLECQIRKMLGIQKTRQNLIKDILYQLTISLIEKCCHIQLNANRNKLCFSNCVLDLDTFKTEPHKREYYQTIQLPYEFKDTKLDLPTTSYELLMWTLEELAPNWCRFLKDFQFSQETLLRLCEWFGYCLVPTTKMEKCLFLKGEGSNGKSTLLEVLISLLGQEQVSSLEPQELFDKFKVCLIQNKLANICGDIETSQVFDARFKKLVSGEDQIGEEKNKRPFQFRPYARFIFSANDFVPTRDRSYAFFRRFDVIEFKRIFGEAEVDKDLKEKLRAEIPYIINWALYGLARLRQNNWKFTVSNEFVEAKAEFESAANPVKQFIEEAIEIAKDPETKIKCSLFRERYVTWCKTKGYDPLADNKLGRELKRLGIEKKQCRDKGVLRTYYLRIVFAGDLQSNLFSLWYISLVYSTVYGKNPSTINTKHIIKQLVI